MSRPASAIDWPRIDARLRQIYRDRKRGQLKVLSIDTGIPANRLSERAQALQLTPLTIKPRAITPEETTLALQLAHLPGRIVQQRLVEAGFPKRRLEYLYSLRWRAQSAGTLDPQDHQLLEQGLYSVEMVASLIGISAHAVRSWIRRGLLKSVQSPDVDHSRDYHIARRDLSQFLKTYPGHWRCHTCDHFWLVDLLTAPTLDKPGVFHRQESCGSGDSGEHALRIAA